MSKQIIDKELSFWWRSLGTGIFVTNNGNIIVNPNVEGSNLVTPNNVYLQSKCTLLGSTWQQVLIMLQNKTISQYLTNLGIKFILDLDDDGCCADGIMKFCVKDECYVEDGFFQYDSFSVVVTFNKEQHEYIRNAIRQGMKIFQKSDLLFAKKHLEKRISDMRALRSERADEEQDYRYDNEIIFFNSELVKINDKLDFINGKK